MYLPRCRPGDNSYRGSLLKVLDGAHGSWKGPGASDVSMLASPQLASWALCRYRISTAASTLPVGQSMGRSHILGSAAVLTIVAALFQIALGLLPRWSAWLGAPASLVARPTMLQVTSVIVAGLLAACAAYAASGAGYVRRLPLLRTALVIIGAVFLLRGLVVVPLLLATLGPGHTPESVPGTALWSSAAFMLLAVLYLGGALANWRTLHASVRARRLDAPAN
jgi:hypothetical protein